MNRAPQFEISDRNIFSLLLCCGGLMAFIGLVIVPTHKSLAAQDRDIATATTQLTQQELLSPVYNDLLRQLQEKETRTLPFPDEEKIGMESLANVISSFKDMARTSHLQVVMITPDFNSVNQMPGQLCINAVLKGEFTNLRGMLTELGGFSALRQIEEIGVESAQGGKEFRIKFWLALRA